MMIRDYTITDLPRHQRSSITAERHMVAAIRAWDLDLPGMLFIEARPFPDGSEEMIAMLDMAENICRANNHGSLTIVFLDSRTRPVSPKPCRDDLAICAVGWSEYVRRADRIICSWGDADYWAWSGMLEYRHLYCLGVDELGNPFRIADAKYHVVQRWRMPKK